MGHAIYQAALWGIFASAILTFVALLFFTAPYGPPYAKRLGHSPRPSLGLVHNGVARGHRHGPHGPIRAPRGKPPPYSFWRSGKPIICTEASVYPFLLPRSGRRSFPVLLIAIALLYNTANAYVNGFWFFEESNSYGYAWLGDIRFIPRYHPLHRGLW